MNSLSRQKLLWFVTGALALVAAILGVAMPSFYDGLIDDRIMPGVLSQDLMTIAAALGLLSLVPFIRQRGIRSRLIVAGLLAYLFYAFGIYTIERIYNELYLVYLATFGLSFYGLVYAATSLDPGKLADLSVPKWIRNISAGYLLVNAVVYLGLWTSQLLPVIQTREKIEFFYSIYILDLCFIMPAFVIVAVMALKGRPFGLVAVPPLLVAGFTVLFPLAHAEFLKPAVYGTAMDTGPAALFAILSGVFLVLAVLYLRPMRTTATTPADPM